jgi:GntR family transcriptional repressor for pyruvate dehydrogenase complex
VIGMLREHITIPARTGNQRGDQLLQQHRAICDAICAHRPEEARAAMQSHIDFVSSHAVGAGG